MSEITEHAPGTFSWADMGTTDVSAAKRYYSELFGWTYKDMPMGDGMDYSMAQIRGLEVAALSPQQPEEKQQGIPPHWTSYVTVKSVDESARKAEELGGKVLMPPFDVMDAGRMTILFDPTGAALALWETKNHIGARMLKEHGSIAWNELLTTDTAKAEAFYTGLFGWTAKAVDMGPMTYTVFSLGEQQVSGMMKIMPDMGPMPPSWMVIFGTDNCDATVERSERQGGKTIAPPMDIPNVGRAAWLLDPMGGAFEVITFVQPAG